MIEGIAEFYAPTPAAWWDWLEAHHTDHDRVWLVYDKGPGRLLSGDDIVCPALCFGWIDSVPGKVDATRSKLYISRRKPKSVWSAVNKERVARMIAEGRMQPSGYAAIELAKSNGSWEALDKSDQLMIDEDLAAAFSTRSQALEYFQAFPAGVRKNILEWIYGARRPETRAIRIAQTVELAEKNLRVNQWRDNA